MAVASVDRKGVHRGLEGQHMHQAWGQLTAGSPSK